MGREQWVKIQGTKTKGVEAGDFFALRFKVGTRVVLAFFAELVSIYTRLR